jgi:hypothetical protein
VDARTRQKPEERIALRVFLEALGLEAEVDEGETPDFRLTVGLRRVALELIGYVRGQKKEGGSPLRQAEAFRSRAP